LNRDTDVNAILSQEVMMDNSDFLVEQENYARRLRQKSTYPVYAGQRREHLPPLENGYAYARGLYSFRDDDNDDDDSGRHCGRKFDGDMGGRGGFGGDMPRFVS